MDLGRQHVNTLRNALSERYLPLIDRVAGWMQRRLPKRVEIEDLVAQGVFGLLGAIEQFRPQRGVRFETFAPRRIEGAMLDALRDLDWAPRTARARINRRTRMIEAFYKKCGRPPGEEELSSMLKAEPLTSKEADVPMICSLERPVSRSDDSNATNTAELIGDSRAIQPLQAVAGKDIRRYLTRHLTRSEYLIVLLYYVEGMTMKQIGSTLDLSESRVSQLHSSLRVSLHCYLRDSNGKIFSSSDHLYSQNSRRLPSGSRK